MVTKCKPTSKKRSPKKVGDWGTYGAAAHVDIFVNIHGLPYRLKKDLTKHVAEEICSHHNGKLLPSDPGRWEYKVR